MKNELKDFFCYDILNRNGIKEGQNVFLRPGFVFITKAVANACSYTAGEPGFEKAWGFDQFVQDCFSRFSEGDLGEWPLFYRADLNDYLRDYKKGKDIPNTLVYGRYRLPEGIGVELFGVKTIAEELIIKACSYEYAAAYLPSEPEPPDPEPDELDELAKQLQVGLYDDDMANPDDVPF